MSSIAVRRGISWGEVVGRLWWWLFFPVWLVTVIAVHQVFPFPLTVPIETNYSVWMPTNILAVDSMVNYFELPGSVWGGKGGGGIASLQLNVSRAEFQRITVNYPNVFVSAERTNKGEWFVKYLGKESASVTSVFFYQEQIKYDRFGYFIDSVRFSDNGLILTLGRDGGLFTFIWLILLAWAGIMLLIWLALDWAFYEGIQDWLWRGRWNNKPSYLQPKKIRITRR